MRSLWITIALAACALAGCADMGSHVRSRAARDLACGKEQTHIEDAEGGVYRVTGCGLVAGYQCTDGSAFEVRCARLYVSKLPDGAGHKSGSDSSLAKAH